VLVIARYVVPATRSDRPTGIDVPGTLAFAATLIALLVPLAEGDSLHWPVWCWVLIAAAAVLGVVTFLIERHSEQAGHTPLLPPSLLRLPSMARGLALYLAFSVGFGAFLFVFALTVQDGIGSGILITMQQAGLALGVAILGSIYLSLAPHSIPAAFVTAVGVQLGIGVLFAVGSRFLPRFTATANHVPIET
jgi:hypothetical protein